MAKIDLDRLTTKYGFDRDDITGQNYRVLVRDIIANNDQEISGAIARKSDEHWNKSVARVRRRRRFILPDVSDVVPTADQSVLKAAEQGNQISDTLRDKLTADLRSTLAEFRTQVTDEPAFLRRRGTRAGTVNPKVIDLYQNKIRETFEAYTKVDPAFGVPGNVKTIAVTEVRTAVRSVKKAYTEQLLERNRNLRAQKKWIQNKSLARKPRPGHTAVSGQTIGYHEKFQVPLYQGDRQIGISLMDGPHDANAPPSQVIGCNCDIEYYMEIA